MQEKPNIEVSPTCINQEILSIFQERIIKNINNSRSSVDEFQSAITKITGSGHALAVNSGTSALHLSLLVLGITSGDFVACSTFTFIATANAIKYCNANPVFIDSELETWNMCPELLEEAIIEGNKNGKAIKAIVVVHGYGYPAKIEEILSISFRYNIPVVEDAASALGSTYKRKCLGTFGEAGVISFNYNKIITTTAGGILLSNNREFINKASYFSNQAKSSGIILEHNAIGYNYRMSGVCAELGNVQLPKLADFVKIKRSIFENYINRLNNIEGIRFLKEQTDIFSNRWITTILFKDIILQQRIKKLFEGKNIEARNLWKPMHHQPVFSSSPRYVNGNAEMFFKTGLCLPSGLNLDREVQEKIIDLLLSHL